MCTTPLSSYTPGLIQDHRNQHSVSSLCKILSFQERFICSQFAISSAKCKKLFNAGGDGILIFLHFSKVFLQQILNSSCNLKTFSQLLLSETFRMREELLIPFHHSQCPTRRLHWLGIKNNKSFSDLIKFIPLLRHSQRISLLPIGTNSLPLSATCHSTCVGVIIFYSNARLRFPIN